MIWIVLALLVLKECVFFGVYAGKNKRIKKLEDLLHIIVESDPDKIAICHKFWNFKDESYGEKEEKEDSEKNKEKDRKIYIDDADHFGPWL